MKTQTKERLYMAVMAVCLVCCVMLLVSVAINRPVTAAVSQHVPVLRTLLAEDPTEQDTQTGGMSAGQSGEGAPALSGAEGGYLLTADFLQTQLLSVLPDSFPAKAVQVTLRDERVALAFTVRRSDLSNYLSDRGAKLSLRQNVMLRLLPKSFELETAFAVSANEGGLHLTPEVLEVNGKEISVSSLPESVFSSVDTGINALLKSQGVVFGSAVFTETGLLLK